MDHRLGRGATQKVLLFGSVASDTDTPRLHFYASLLPKPLPVMTSYNMKRKLYALFLLFFFSHTRC
jgi:hypothetical protein